MRIVNLETFRLLPAGTLFMKFAPHCFEDLCVKGDTLEHDFISAHITQTVASENDKDWADKLFAAVENPNLSLDLDLECYGRDGLFEKDQLFAVYEKKDIEGLMRKLEECYLNVYWEEK